MCAGRREELVLQRKRALKSQAAVAAKLGISQAGYSLIENGYYAPSPENAAKLIDMFDLPDDYFGSRDGEQEAQ